ncbi:aldehyde dehydrogenase family protein, partial [Klebsiella pneumoniae]|nr:aldehyde dehydrogenase family protein [Klebsiella pneumoniae]
FTFRVPVGVAVVITAGNFPVAAPSWYMVPALLCGNAMVWKPAEYAAAAARALAELAWRAGVPRGVLNLVYADGEATYRGLESALSAGTVNKVGFTGSSAVGSRIGELCGRHLQTPCLELGGKNPMVVAPDADLDLAVEGALFSGWGTAGQRCTSLGNLIVHNEVKEEFVRRLDAALRSAPIGDPRSEVLYGPLLSEKFAENFEQVLDTLGSHHTPLGSEFTGRITDSAPRKGFVGDPQSGLY